MGMGSVLLEESSGKQFLLRDVLFVPSMMKNLVSVSEHVQSGEHKVTFLSDECCVSSSTKWSVLVKGKITSNLYQLDLRSPNSSASAQPL